MGPARVRVALLTISDRQSFARQPHPQEAKEKIVTALLVFVISNMIRRYE